MTYYMMKKKIAELLENAIKKRMNNKAKKNYTIDQDINAMENLTITYLELLEQYEKEKNNEKKD